LSQGVNSEFKNLVRTGVLCVLLMKVLLELLRVLLGANGDVGGLV